MSETYDFIIRFVKFSEKKNRLDEIEREPIFTPVFADIPELTQFEQTQAQADGFKPEIKFVIAEHLEYGGERVIDHEGKYYKIIRSKKTKKERELAFICESTINPWEVDSDADAETGSEV